VEHPVAVPAVTTTATAAQTSAAAPVIPANEASTVAQPSLSNQRANDLSVDVHTDVLHLKIGLEQGDIIHTALLDYPLSTAEKNKPFVLLQNNPSERYVANSELFVLNNGQPLSFNPNFNTQYQTYQLRPDQDKLVVVLQGKTADGIAISKTFTFKRGSYLIDIQYSIANNSDMPWKGYMNTQLLRASPQEDTSSMFHVGSYTGASYSAVTTNISLLQSQSKIDWMLQ
jgi:YidC/Oxa1 family membrane protein insertase